MLESLRILDLTWILGGPFASQLLAQLGAEVIKIEPPDGDQSRNYPPHYFAGDSAFFLSVNRGKKSVALDLKRPEGRQALYDLVASADAVMYGYAPDVPKRLGIDFESLKKINARIVVGELIGLHDEGPFAAAPSVDIIAQALGGVMSITGEPNGKPVRVGYQIADLAAGLYLASGILAGLIKALKSGAGSKVQVSLVDCQLALLTWQAQNYFVTGEVPQALGSRHATLAPSEVFLCADGRHIAMSAATDQFWQPFCDAVHAAELANDARFATAELRLENVEALATELQAIFARAGADEWAFLLSLARIPVGKVNNVAEALAQPIAMLRDMVEELTHPTHGGLMRFLAGPIKYQGSEASSYPPQLGMHTREVLHALCGYEPAKLDALEQKGAIKSKP